MCSQVSTYCVLGSGVPWTVGAPLNGEATYACYATSGGGATSTCSGSLSAADVGPSITPQPGTIALWPPNHKMQTIQLSDCVSSAVDACTGQPIDVDARGKIVRVTSDEPEDAAGDGDGQTCNDIQISSTSSFQLRRERDGAGNGRLYSIYFQVPNARGTTTDGVCRVSVPFSDSSAAPVDDGVRYCVGTGCPPQPACGR